MHNDTFLGWLAMLTVVFMPLLEASLFGSCRIFTMVCRPPRSAMARRICVLREISFKIFKAPIWENEMKFLSNG